MANACSNAAQVQSACSCLGLSLTTLTIKTVSILTTVSIFTQTIEDFSTKMISKTQTIDSTVTSLATQSFTSTTTTTAISTTTTTSIAPAAVAKLFALMALDSSLRYPYPGHPNAQFVDQPQNLIYGYQAPYFTWAILEDGQLLIYPNAVYVNLMTNVMTFTSTYNSQTSSTDLFCNQPVLGANLACYQKYLGPLTKSTVFYYCVVSADPMYSYALPVPGLQCEQVTLQIIQKM